MAIEHVNTATSYVGAGGEDITVDKPTGVVNGSVLTAVISGRAATPDVPAPTDWVKVTQANETGTPTFVALFYKVITDASGEPASYTFSTETTTPTQRGGIISNWSGVDTTTPSAATATTNFLAGTGSSTPTGLSVTTSVDDAMLLLPVVWRNSGRTHTEPTDWAEIFENPASALSAIIQATAGASGNKEAALVGGDDRWGTILWALAPEAGGAVPLTVQSASHAHTAQNVVLTQHHVLAANNAAHAHTVQNIEFELPEFLAAWAMQANIGSGYV